jgi:hypothetical protein
MISARPGSGFSGLNTEAFYQPQSTNVGGEGRQRGLRLHGENAGTQVYDMRP